VGAALALLLVFGAGIAGGVALERTWLDEGGGDRSSGKEKGEREHTVIERFSEELELTPDQEARIDTILAQVRDRMHEMWSEVRPRYRAVVDSARGRIQEVLTEEQAERYRELLKREAERRDDRWGDGKGRDTARGGAAGEARP
jgi:Spy/CpxP family protein refolding chaperone